MKSPCLTTFAVMIIHWFFVSCIHTYPSLGSEEDPTLINLEISVDIDDSWLDKDAIAEGSKAIISPDLRIRCIVEDNGRTMADDCFIISTDGKIDGLITLPQSYRLKPDDYDIYLWADWVDGMSHDPIAYDVSSPSDIIPLYGNGDYSAYHSCFAALKAVDLRQFDGEWNVGAEVEINPKHVTGQLQIVATDYDEFYSTEGYKLNSTAKFSVYLECKESIPSAFDLISDCPTRPLDDVAFSLPIEITSLPIEEMIIAYDRLFLPDSLTDFLISVSIMNEAKAIVSRIENIKVPMMRGYITTVRGNFFTSHIEGGITVDPSWNGEVDIVINPL